MRVAAIQLCSTDDKRQNLRTALALLEKAVKKKAELIALPEYFPFIGSKGGFYETAESEKTGEAYELASSFAKSRRVHLLAGTIAMKAPSGGDKRLINRSILFGPDGKEIAHYDKLHLFDAELSKQGSYRESETFRPGDEVKVANTAFGKLGLAICYDLRFPELFRALTFKGAKIIFVPAAFTAFTGKAHWLELLRARAIENQVFIVAPAQVGAHSPKKRSYGKTCIIDPWGTVLAVAPNRPSMIFADLDFEFQDQVRRQLPALKHFRSDLFKT